MMPDKDPYHPGHNWPPLVVRIVPYDAAWPARFRAEAADIGRALELRAEEVLHVGSTSVEGLASKPVIDILIFHDAPRDEAVRERLRGIGYVYERVLPDPTIRFLAKGDHDFHLELAPRDARHQTEKVALRDYLRAHPAEAAEYGRRKAEIASSMAGDPRSYVMGKAGVIDDILSRALAWAASPRQ